MLQVSKSPLALRLALFFLAYQDSDVDESLCSKAMLFFESVDGRTGVKITQTGVLQVFSTTSLFLFPLSYRAAASLRANYMNWRVFQEKDIGRLVDYYLAESDYLGIQVYEIEKMRPVTDLAIGAKVLHDFISFDSATSDNSFALYDFQEMSQQISVRLDLPDFTRLGALVKKEAGDVGVIHGDFHIDNLMINSSGAAVIIDLDRVAWKGPKLFDEIHYTIVSQGSGWLEHVCNLIESGSESRWSSNVLIAYTINRIYAEVSSAKSVHPLYVLRVKKFLDSIIGVMEADA